MPKNENRPTHVSTPETLWKDLGFSPAEAAVERLKTKLHIEITKAVKKRKLTPKDVARLLNIQQPHVSKLLRGDLSRTTVDRLTRYLYLLGKTVSVTVKAGSKTQRTGVA